jgi:hypothetical protein
MNMHTKAYLPTYNFKDTRFSEEDGISLECTMDGDTFVLIYYKGSEFYVSKNDVIELANILKAFGG